MSKQIRTSIYIDGLNLYYGCVRNSPYKWLDLKKLFSQLLKKHNDIDRIQYFTAMVKPTPKNLNAPKRQHIYLQALQKHIPEIEIHYGHFLISKTNMPLAKTPHHTVQILKTEEKGSDVNLAVNLLNDAWLDLYDCAVVVSNDSDMAESLKIVRKNFPAKIIGLITPGENTRTSRKLSENAHFVKKIRNSFLRSSQLPDSIPGTNIKKPDDWKDSG